MVPGEAPKPGSGSVSERLDELHAFYRDRIAAGLVREGSECFGFDDELSRDHDRGPGFCLWLTADDYIEVGTELQRSYEVPVTME
jgi:hypothetical protein